MPTLTDLFKAQKADKYTQDGRETLDKVYQIGEISQKTGLQKTANGWVPPKSTKYGKVTTNKEGKVGIQQTLGKGSKFEEFANEKAASRALANLTAGYNTTERSKEDPHSDKARQLKHWDKETEQIRKENKAERRAAHAAQFQNKAGAPAGANGAKNTSGEATGTETRIQKYNRLLKENISKVEMLKNKPYKDVKSQLEKMGYILQGHSGWEPFGSERGLPEIELYRDRNGNAKISIAPYVEQKEMNMPKLAEMEKYSASAPRQLTGDTRIRMNQVTDKVYQIGEISQKTGLQKTANGWVKPKQGAGISKEGNSNKEIETELNKEEEWLNHDPKGKIIKNILENGEINEGFYSGLTRRDIDYTAQLAEERMPNENEFNQPGKREEYIKLNNLLGKLENLKRRIKK